ncbi:ImmA/IrrE family metallo-endopeptidase [Macrococcoides caseolyticum]|uniref:spr1629 family repressor/antitoxin n=1 Tax=Macrococcoides caseolyticum TaxID=69966 RepID=UPI0010604B11|nr:XRE family transcriptional regulator [Macrococcus caseolyticus]TDM28737.1 ImmA/IrrE family metallo-endopeptidase [Macrococcus caseolyticus]
MFIGKNLNTIRMLRGYSRKELAGKINVTEQAIWQYEVKNLMPDIKNIYDLSQIFNVKTNFFLNDTHKIFDDDLNVKRSHIAFRSLNHNINNKIIYKQHMQAVFLNNLTNLLYGFLKVPDSLFIKLSSEVQNIIEKSGSRNDIIAEVAKVARNYLMPNEYSSKDLLFNLEKSGIIIYEKQIDEDADAYSFWTEDKKHAFIILGNDKNIAVRRSFDLSHELGHLLLHQNVEFELLDTKEYRVIEEEANIFASMFLLPEDEFKKDFDQINKKSNPDSYIMIKEKWFVSYQMIAVRAYKLNLISQQQYRYFWMSINKKGYKKREPLDDKLIIDRPMKIKSIFKLLFNNNIINIEKVLEEMHVEIDFLSEYTGIEKDFFKEYLSEKQNSSMFIEKNFKIKN